MTPDQDSRSQRPKRIVVFSVVVALIALFHLLRLLAVLLNWSFLRTRPYGLPVLYLGLDGLIWGSAGLVLLIGLWTGRSWARTAGMVLTGLYTAARWADLILAADPELLPVRWPIALIGSVIGLGSALWVLSSRPSRKFFDR